MNRILLTFFFSLLLNSLFAQVDSSLALAKEIKAKLNAGADFCELARLYSEDTQTKANCGELGRPFGKGELMRGYEDAMVALKIGQISEVVQTGYGYHIIQLVGVVKKQYETRHILIKYR